MKGFVFGFLSASALALTLNCAARSVDIQFSQVSARDVYAASALSGLISSNRNMSPSDIIDWSFKYADLAMNKRK